MCTLPPTQTTNWLIICCSLSSYVRVWSICFPVQVGYFLLKYTWISVIVSQFWIRKPIIGKTIFSFFFYMCRSILLPYIIHVLKRTDRKKVIKESQIMIFFSCLLSLTLLKWVKFLFQNFNTFRKPAIIFLMLKDLLFVHFGAWPFLPSTTFLTIFLESISREFQTQFKASFNFAGMGHFLLMSNFFSVFACCKCNDANIYFIHRKTVEQICLCILSCPFILAWVAISIRLLVLQAETLLWWILLFFLDSKK